MPDLIDAHAHLGDILYANGGALIEKIGVKKPIRFDVFRVEERLSTVSPSLTKLLLKLFYSFSPTAKWISHRYEVSSEARNAMATRENLTGEMEKHGVGQTVLLPVYPYVTFDDLAAAAEKDGRFLPYTGADFDRLDSVDAKFADNVARGAKGLKLHPILQRSSLQSPETFQVVEAFAPHDLPVLFHAGVCTYYTDPSLNHLQSPDFGLIEQALDLIKGFPNVKFVAAHGALNEVDTLIELFSEFDNVWVDMSFQYPAQTKQLIDAFGAERILFGSDWPWGGLIRRSPMLRWRVAPIKRLKIGCFTRMRPN